MALIHRPALSRRSGSARFDFAAAIAAVLVVAGCGTTRMTFVDSPAPPVELSVYISGHGVSLSPRRLGAGQVNVLVTNQTARPLILDIGRRGRQVASSRPIAAGANNQFRVDLRPGRYALDVALVHATDAQLALGTGIAPAALLIGRPRPNGNNALLQP